VTGTVIGGLSAMMGIGGGSFGGMMMSLCGRPIHQAVATASGFGLAIGTAAPVDGHRCHWAMSMCPGPC
jgi:hypothetical protein